jgi:hypothetical protein
LKFKLRVRATRRRRLTELISPPRPGVGGAKTDLCSLPDPFEALMSGSCPDRGETASQPGDDLEEAGPGTGPDWVDRGATIGPESIGAETLTMDPRFARRRAEIQRQRHRRRMRIVSMVAAVVVICIAAVVSVFTPLARVRHLRVEVAGPVSAAQVIALAGLNGRTLMIHDDPASIAHRLDAVPYLGDARVSRQLPATIRISVAVRSPVAAVALLEGGGEEWGLVDVTGRVLSISAAPPPGLPAVYGVTSVPTRGAWIAGAAGPKVAVGSPGVDMAASAVSSSAPSGVALALAAVGSLVPAIRADVASATISPSGELTLGVLPPGVVGAVKVNIGDGSQLAAKLAALGALLNSSGLAGETSVDVSVPDRPTALTAR